MTQKAEVNFVASAGEASGSCVVGEFEGRKGQERCELDRSPIDAVN